jgi:predicted GH43/DUF377 family glycosyl hydrolase
LRPYAELAQRLRTPHKREALVLAPSHRAGAYDSHAVDCPFVFRREGRFAMIHLGWDGIGYRTGLAWSDDLIHWRKEGLILDRGPQGSATEFSAALTWVLRDNDLFGSGELTPVNGWLLGTYQAYPAPGYEVGPGRIGLCRSRDLREWDLDAPCLDPAQGGAWERGGLYKACLVRHDGTYYLFYNAKNAAAGHWIEQIGLATARDLTHWRRHPANPVLRVGPRGAFDDRFASEPCVLRCGDAWAMFYFGLCSDGHARDSVAFSEDLIHWEKSNQLLVDVGPSGAADALHAHKPSLFTHEGRLYHYYCAVAPADGPRSADGVDWRERRGIALCTS